MGAIKEFNTNLSIASPKPSPKERVTSLREILKGLYLNNPHRIEGKDEISIGSLEVVRYVPINEFPPALSDLTPALSQGEGDLL